MAEPQGSDAPASDGSTGSILDLINQIPALNEQFGEPEKPATETEEVQDSVEGQPAKEGEAVEEEVISQEETKEEGEEPEPEVKEEEKKEEPVDNVQKRINKLVAQKKSADEKIAELEAKLSESKKEYVPVPSQEDPLSDVMSLDQLKEKIDIAERAREWAFENPDGGTIKLADGTEHFIDAKEARKMLSTTDKLLRKDAPAREQWIKAEEVNTANAKKLFPDLFNSNHQWNQIAQQWERMVPGIKAIPSYKYVIGCALYGEQMLMAQQNKSKAAKPAPKAAPSSPKPGPGSSTTSKVSSKEVNLPKHGASRAEIEQYIADKVFDGLKF